MGLRPEREAHRVAVSPLASEGTPDLAIDGTERRQRPTDPTRQKAPSSGKTKAPTDNNLLLGKATTRQVVSRGPTIAGKTHDKKAAEEAALVSLTHATRDKDTGFQGYEPAGGLTRQPKKPQGRELSVGEQWLTGIFSRARVVVEHVMAGVKRCRMVKDVVRLTTQGISDVVMEIACGLHNLRVSCRHPLPTFDVRDWLSSA